MARFTDFPTDVVDLILSHLPDFHTLAAAIKVSKAHTYSQIGTRRPSQFFRPAYLRQCSARTESVRFIRYGSIVLNSAVTSVAINVAGPALPHALQVALAQEFPETPVNLNYNESIDATANLLLSLNSSQRQLLEKSTIAVQELEDLFSQIYKDRRFNTSVLLSAESLRLKTALYRFWLLCLQLANEELPETWEVEEDWALGDIWNGTLDTVVDRLASYDTPDLLDVVAIAPFLQEILRRIIRVINERTYEGLEFTAPVQPGPIGDPGLVHQRLHEPRVQTKPFWGFELSSTIWSAMLNKLKFARDLDDVALLSVAPTRFLAEVTGAYDTCYGCNVVRGMKLFGRPNWHFLDGLMSTPPIIQRLPGNLPRNPVEIGPLLDFFVKEDGFDWRAFTEEIFDFNMRSAEEFLEWDKEQWYCKSCILDLFATRFPWWWMARARDANTPIKENCRYGWNCRMQTRRLPNIHSMELNVSFIPVAFPRISPEQHILVQHFCEPIEEYDDSETST
ncbi:hypothetical protein BC629DRAFT_1588974 [Irpex lacteus]|nr:hypothetical protein BC629DRAFT_1588974 [Irpex lacteus]